MAESHVRLGPFRGLITATEGAASPNFAGDGLNFRVGDGAIKPRYGYRNLAGKPSGIVNVWGLERLLGYGDDYLSRLEWVSIEDRGGTVKPYSIDPTTYARTEITDGGTALSLDASDWLGFSFDSNSYWINPGGAASLYRHEVGNDESWTAIQNSAYVPPAANPVISVSLNSLNTRDWLGTDTISLSSTGQLNGEASSVVGGQIEVTGSEDDGSGGTGYTNVEVLFATSVDFSICDYFCFELTAGVVVTKWRTGATPVELKIAGSWVATSDQEQYVSTDERTFAQVVRVKGVSGISAVDGIRFQAHANPVQNKTGLAFRVPSLYLGGTYIGALTSGARVWDSPYKSADVPYAIRYLTVAGGAVSGITNTTVDSSRFGQLSVTPSSVLGDIVEIDATPATSGGYTDDPTGLVYRIQFLRKDGNDDWHVLGDYPNTVGAVYFDRYEEWEVRALATTTVTGYVAPETPPVFDSTGFVGGVPFKGWVVWFRSGGRSNVQHSEVGDPESLAPPVGNPDDLTEGANFTLADDFADEPLGGVQAGDVLLIVGNEGVYGQAGNYPKQMTPPRKLPGSMGCAGRFAYARFRDENGNPGVAWLDVSGENIWFAAAGLFYSVDTQARPAEISAPIRGFVRDFIYQEQRETLPDLAISEARMDVDEATGTLWLVLGQRALVLRPPSVIDGQRQWEPYQFNLGSETGDVAACSDPFGPSSGIAQARPPSTITWTDPNDVIEGSGVASSDGYLPGLSSYWLKGLTFTPNVLLPAEATLTDLTLRIRQRATTVGDPDSRCPVQLKAIDAYNGATLKHSAVGSLVPDDWENVDIDLPLADMATTIAGINAGDISGRVAYDAVPDTADAYNPAKWSVTVTPDQAASALGTLSASQNMTVTATWIGGGTPPTFVALNLTGSATGYGAGHLGSATSYTGTAAVANGLGDTASGVIVGPAPDPPPAEQTASGSKKFVVSTSSGVGFKTVTMTAAVTVAPGGTQDAAAVFHIEGEIATPDATTIEVESLLLIACYTVPQAEGERRIAYTAFGPDRKLIWIRGISGHLDAVEWCPTCYAYIGGTNRDGGQEMPEGFWESSRIAGLLRRLSRVDADRDEFVPLTLIARTDRNTGETHALPNPRRWQAFSPRVQGDQHFIRVNVSESVTAVRSFDMTFVRTGGPSR